MICILDSRLKELPKQDKNPIALHHEPHQRPAQQDQKDTCPEGRATTPLLSPREEEEGALGPEEQGDADEEEDVAHGEQGAVEEEDEAEEEEEAAYLVRLAVGWEGLGVRLGRSYHRCRRLRLLLLLVSIACERVQWEAYFESRIASRSACWRMAQWKLFTALVVDCSSNATR